MRFNVILATGTNREFSATLELEEYLSGVGVERMTEDEKRAAFDSLEVDVRRRCINNFGKRGLRVVRIERVL
jgi:hypothetical protein